MARRTNILTHLSAKHSEGYWVELTTKRRYLTDEFSALNTGENYKIAKMLEGIAIG